MAIIEIERLKKSYGKHVGVRDVSLSANQGEILGFVGPNGAGKSTTIKALMGFILPDGGRASVCGLDAGRDSRKIKTFTGYVPAEVRLYPTMTVNELLRRSAGFYAVDCGAETRRLTALFEIDTGKRFHELSSGNKKKVSIVCALMPGPRVIVLDEPTNGLDPMMQRRLFEELARRTKEGATVLLSSHNLTEVQAYCHRVAFIRKGVILAITELAGAAEAAKIITVTGGQAEAPPGLELMPGGNGQRAFRTTLDTPALLAALTALGPQDITIENESIEARFWSLYDQEDEA